MVSELCDLSPAERRLVLRLALDERLQEAARALCIEYQTAKNLLLEARRKAGTRTTHGLVLKAYRAGLI